MDLKALVSIEWAQIVDLYICVCLSCCWRNEISKTGLSGIRRGCELFGIAHLCLTGQITVKDANDCSGKRALDLKMVVHPRRMEYVVASNTPTRNVDQVTSICGFFTRHITSRHNM